MLTEFQIVVAKGKKKNCFPPSLQTQYAIQAAFFKSLQSKKKNSQQQNKILVQQMIMNPVTQPALGLLFLLSKDKKATLVLRKYDVPIHSGE